MFLAVGLVLFVQWSTSRQILSDLGGRSVLRNLAIMELGIRAHLDPARRIVDNLGRLIESGAYDLSDADRISDLLTGSAAAAPQIGTMIVADKNLKAVRLRRDPTTDRYRLDRPDLSGSPRFVAEEREIRLAQGSHWGNLFYDPDSEITFINVRRPLIRDGEYIGLVVAAITTKELSDLTSELGEMFGSRTFVLYGEDRVLAPGLPKTRSGKIMRRILRKIAADDFSNLGDTSTLADPAVVDDLIDNRQNRAG